MFFRALQRHIPKFLKSTEVQKLETRFLRNNQADVVIRAKRVETVAMPRTRSTPTPNPRVSRSRMGSRHSRLSSERTQITMSNIQEEDHIDIELDRIASSITKFGSNNYTAFEAERERTKDLVKMRSFVKAKTLENRYFRQPKKPNLLTWSCKEQIRFLHERDPDVWSVEVLAQTLPVSEISVMKILKSRVRLHRLIDIKEHDSFVEKNWENVLTSLSSKHTSSRDDFTQEVLNNIGNTSNILNIFSLKNGTAPKQLSVVGKKLGIFASMVKDEFERKEQLNSAIQESHQKQLDNLRNTVQRVRNILAKRSTGEEILSEAMGNNEEEQHESITQLKKDPVEFGIFSKTDRGETSTYVVDKCVYDEDGEFLYKIP